MSLIIRTQLSVGQKAASSLFLKKSDLRIAKNCQGITLTSIAAKIYNCYIARYGRVWNWHIMFIYIYNIEHRISKHEKHLTTSQFKYETFYYLWVKGFDIRKRDTHSFYSGLFICSPPSHAAPATKVSASKWKPTIFSWGRSHLNSSSA